LENNFTNAFFEAMSGLTTTGATVIVGLDKAPQGLLLWRALLQWLGGIGIIGVAIAVLPALGVGGMQLFRTESSDRSEKVMPRVREIATALTLIYLGFTVLCAILYWLAGMTPFEALAHSLTTVSTAGFSTSDASMGNFSATAQWIGTAFMVAGGIPFVLYVRLLQGNRHGLRDSQVRTFLSLLLVVIIGVTAWLVLSGRYGFEDALRLAAFNVVSVVTTTGYATSDYGLWGNAAVGVFFGLMFIGGLYGLHGRRDQNLPLRGHGEGASQSSSAPDLSARCVPAHVCRASPAGRCDLIRGGVLRVLLSLLQRTDHSPDGHGPRLSDKHQCGCQRLANVGPGLGPTIGPAGNFSTIPDPAKWLLALRCCSGGWSYSPCSCCSSLSSGGGKSSDLITG
jgi:trk system potassium uptake protein TrkH